MDMENSVFAESNAAVNKHLAPKERKIFGAINGYCTVGKDMSPISAAGCVEFKHYEIKLLWKSHFRNY